MSLYRFKVMNGVLVREKRGLLRFWQWSFNRSEEDRLNTMKNNLVKANQARHSLAHQIKEETERIKKAKDSLAQWPNGSPTWRDRWWPRKEPVVLLQNINVARKKKERAPQPQAPTLARIVAGSGK